jgi:hypothetical protein
VQWSFREIGSIVSTDADGDMNLIPIDTSGETKPLTQIYLIVQALGRPFQNDLLERFAQLQLIPYEKAFKSGTKFANLDSLDKRYAWFKQLIQAARDKLDSIIPVSWNLPSYLFIEFIRRTKNHIFDILTGLEKRSGSDAFKITKKCTWL